MPNIDKKELQNISTLYLKEGYSMQGIADKYDTSLNAVVYFMRKYKIPRRTSGQTHHKIWKNRPPRFKTRKAMTTKQKILDAMGAMLYWGEGYKTEKASGIDFANSDPLMVLTFITFLRNRYVLDENRFRIYLYIHKNQKEDDLVEYWSSVLSIPKLQFTKPYVAKKTVAKNKRTNKMKYGLVHIRYHDKKLLKDILSLIESHSTTFCVDGGAVNRVGL